MIKFRETPALMTAANQMKPSSGQKTYMVEKDGQTGQELAQKKGVQGSIAVSFQGNLYDLTKIWPAGADISFVKRNDPEALSLLRHDAAHLLAQALTELFPGIELAIGPATQDGFYYDFLLPQPLGEDAMAAIEERMHQIVDRADSLVRSEWTQEKALSFFKKQGQSFKIEIIQDLPPEAVISVYQQGAFIDLCKGPHLPSTKDLGHGFKLLKLAGAYWRGDSKNPMLQRLYGTCFPDEKQLRLHLKQREEAEKRDHRRLGNALNLFHFQEEARGDVFWHPKGWSLYQTLQTYMRKRMDAAGYQEIRTPQMLSRSLWEASGHWDKFREAMITGNLPDHQEGKEPLALKPMNCPGHVEVFKQRLRSYKDLPLRLAEFGCCTRFEPSGALFGLMRLRAFTQDDAHIFCSPDMISQETKTFCALLQSVYQDLGFESLDVLFSDRPKVRAGSDAVWDAAEAALQEGARAANLTCGYNPGEGAFYGPKLEFVLKDALGRSWQCGTLQVDLILPERLKARYIGADGAKHTPVMLHRAILGSFERFIGILIEHYGGAFPAWLAPIQLVLMPISQDQNDAVTAASDLFKKAGLRVHCDLRPDKIHGKIREWSLQKVPSIGIIGDQEKKERTINLRPFGQKEKMVLSLDIAVKKLASEAEMPHDLGI